MFILKIHKVKHVNLWSWINCKMGDVVSSTTGDNSQFVFINIIFKVMFTYWKHIIHRQKHKSHRTQATSHTPQPNNSLKKHMKATGRFFLLKRESFEPVCNSVHQNTTICGWKSQKLVCKIGDSEFRLYQLKALCCWPFLQAGFPPKSVRCFEGTSESTHTQQLSRNSRVPTCFITFITRGRFCLFSEWPCFCRQASLVKSWKNGKAPDQSHAHMSWTYSLPTTRYSCDQIIVRDFVMNEA